MINLLAMGWLNLPRWAHSWVEIRKPFRLIPHWTRLSRDHEPLRSLDFQLLEQLAHLLVQHDARAGELASDLAPIFLNSSKRVEWLELESAIARYDFKSSLITLGKLKNSLEHVHIE